MIGIKCLSALNLSKAGINQKGFPTIHRDEANKMVKNEPLRYPSQCPSLLIARNGPLAKKLAMPKDEVRTDNMNFKVMRSAPFKGVCLVTKLLSSPPSSAILSGLNMNSKVIII